MALIIAGRPTNAEQDSGTAFKEVTTTTLDDKTALDTTLISSDGSNIEIGKEGQIYSTLVNNSGDDVGDESQSQTSLLTDILKELKKITFHMSILTDNNIKNSEVE